MHLIRPITSITQQDLERIVPGYSSSSIFEVTTKTKESEVSFHLFLKELARPFVKRHDYSDSAILNHYNAIIAQGVSYGAFVNEKLEGFILSERQPWNSTLVIREFGVAPEARQQGFGKALLEKALSRAKKEALRGVLCETQSTNVPAIRLYRKLGFTIQGLDLSLYTNEDTGRGEVAIFLRKALI